MATSSRPESSAANSSVSAPIMLAWDRATIEEVARVIELEPVGQRPAERFERGAELNRQSTGRRGAVDGEAPQVAERAGERAFGAGEKDRHRALDHSPGRTLVFEQDTVRLPRVD